MKEYQLKSERDKVLPREVYHQCIWIVRDMARMKAMLGQSIEGVVSGIDGRNVEVAGVDGSRLQYRAMEAVIRIDAIKLALETIPQEYQNGIITSIVNRGVAYGDFAHENTWKRWRHRFIYALAYNLGLI